jgi:hypothetical protein
VILYQQQDAVQTGKGHVCGKNIIRLRTRHNLSGPN